MLFHNCFLLTCLSITVALTASASSPSSDIKQVTKKKVLVRTTKLDEPPSAAPPSDNLQENKSGRCEFLGTVFAEGSAMASSHDCSFCYCIRGQRQCVTPRCKLPLRGCKPRYRSSSCCPTFYDCHDALSITTTNPTTTTTTSTTTETTTTSVLSTKEQTKVATSRFGCYIDGQKYFEGQFMPGVGGSCRACYCLRGRQQCTEMRCRPPVKGCTPVMAEEKCCPIRYDCETNENIVSRSNGKLPRSDLLPESGYKFNFDYDASDIDARVMENHVRIERQSDPDPKPESELEIVPEDELDLIAEESEVINTTELPLPDDEQPVEPVVVEEETTVDSVVVDQDVPLPANYTDSKYEVSPTVSEETPQEEVVKEGNVEATPVEPVETEIDPEIAEQPISNDNIQEITKPGNIVGIELRVQDANISISPDIVTEHSDIDYYYDYDSINDTANVPTLSIKEILSKLRTQNEGSVGTLADLLPDPITGTRDDNENIPEEPVITGTHREQDKTDFVSYDIDVGTSLIAGTGDDDIVGVGHVIPIDLHAEDDIFPSRYSPIITTTTVTSTTSHTPSTIPASAISTTTTTTEIASTEDTPTIKSIATTSIYTSTEKTKPKSSFLNTFLNLFRGGTKPGEKIEKPSTIQLSPPSFAEVPPPPFLNPISREENLNADIFEAPAGPVSFFRPPPMEEVGPPPEDLYEDEFVLDTKNELEGELDLDSKPTIENEVRSRPKPPNGSITRNELPIIRRPTTTTGSKPFYPGLFASRPKLPVNLPSEDQDETVEHNLPSDPLVEGGFAAIKPASVLEESKDEEIGLENEEPTLPPSLPNLKIIPFVAADALVNQGSPPDDGVSGFTPRPFGSASAQQDCREGGKVWINGEAVAKGDNDPCVLCRCLLGKVICQQLECPSLPNGCTAEETPSEGECCPKITCDKSANVSIVDTLPSFRPIKDETEETSSPIRASLFSHQNRRPPFAPASRRPKPSKPLSTLRKPIIPPRLRPTKKPATEEEPAKTEENETSKAEPKRPVRPFSRPPPAKPLRNSVPQITGGRPRPFSFLNRTGTRPPFVPPRRTHSPPILATTLSSDSEITDLSETLDSVSTLSDDKILLTEPEIPHRKFSPETAEEPVKSQTEQDDQQDFENIFAELLPKDKDSLPQPIHRDQFEQPIHRDQFEQPIHRDQFEPQPVHRDQFEQPIHRDQFEPQPVHRDQFEDSLDADFGAGKPFILPSDILAPSPLPPNNNAGLDGEITNFVKQDKFRFTQSNAAPEVKFGSPIRIQKPTKRLPEIPEVVKAQLPLGNDPILVSGLFELGGCNVYGRMFEVGEEIQEISGQCKACQCTKVGVQCLPIC